MNAASNYKEHVLLFREILDDQDLGGIDPESDAFERITRLAELVVGLDDFRKKGGHAPFPVGGSGVYRLLLDLLVASREAVGEYDAWKDAAEHLDVLGMLPEELRRREG